MKIIDQGQSEKVIQSITHAASAAEAMQSLANTAAANAKRQLRAYLFIDDAFIRNGESDDGPEYLSAPVVFYTIKNNGQTPAYKVSVLHTAEMVDLPFGKIVTPIEIDYLGTIAPRGDVVEDMRPGVIGTGDPTDFREKAKGAVLRGVITYKDAFGDTQTTDFHFTHKGPIDDPRSRMAAESEGNDAT